MSQSSTLAYWQRLHGLSDDRAAELLGLRRGFAEVARRSNNGTDPVA